VNIVVTTTAIYSKLFKFVIKFGLWN
jgi:hypothetical protein